MRTLLEDGIDKAARGLTTLDEVLRVVIGATRPLDAAADGRAGRHETSHVATAAAPTDAAEADATENAGVECSSSKTARRSCRS